MGFFNWLKDLFRRPEEFPHRKVKLNEKSISVPYYHKYSAHNKSTTVEGNIGTYTFLIYKKGLQFTIYIKRKFMDSLADLDSTDIIIRWPGGKERTQRTFLTFALINNRDLAKGVTILLTEHGSPDEVLAIDHIKQDLDPFSAPQTK